MTPAPTSVIPEVDEVRPRPCRDPYPVFARLRDLDPELWRTRLRWRGLVRYDDVRAALRDPRLASAPTSRYFRRFLFAQVPPEERAALAPVADAHAAMLVYADGERHRRLRGAIQAALTPGAVEALRPRIAAVIDDLLDGIARADRADLIAGFARPLPAIVTATLFGLPIADARRFARWSEDTFSLTGTDAGRPANALRSRRTLDEARAYLRAVAATRAAEGRREPRDLLDLILGAEFDELDTVATFLAVLSGGYETASNLLGNGLLALLRHPDQLALLREADDPALVERAVEELARYDSPVQLATRVATEPLEIGGKPVRRGEVVECWLGAANRDPDRFPDPDRLDLRREEVRHLAFGRGPHFCVGAALARLQARLALPAVLRRLPDLRLAVDPDELRWKPVLTFRGLEALPVRFRPAPVLAGGAPRRG